MKLTNTTGVVRRLEAHTVGYGETKRVVGTMVTVQTRVTDDSGIADVDTQVFLSPNSVLPVMADTVTVVIATEENLELESFSANARKALGITEDDGE